MRWTLVAVCLAILVTLVSCGNRSPDRAALVALYNATDGPNWSSNEGWLSDDPIGEWDRVFTDDSGLVTSLYLGYEQLTGPIPPELGNLSNLRTLSLYGNRLTGPVPPELGNLSNLTELDLSSNQLTGPIPSELGNLSNLTELDLSSNRLTGPVPPELGNLSNLRYMGISGNNLVGCVPEDLLKSAISADSHQVAPRMADPREITVVGRTSGTAELSIGQRQPADWPTGYSYELYRSNNGKSGPYNLVKSDITRGEFVDEGLAPDTTYYYRAEKCNSCGCLDMSDFTVGVITEVNGLAEVPSTPTSIAGRKFVLGGTTDEAGVTWQRSPGATFYQVYQGSALDAEVSAPATEYRDYSPNTSFFAFRSTSYKVRACNKAGCSAFTDTITIR